MRDLYFTLATYGACVSEDKVNETLDSNEFIINVYGGSVDPREPSIDFNTCRWQIAELNCIYIDLNADKDSFKSSSQIDFVKKELGSDKNILFVNAHTAVGKNDYCLKNLLDLLCSFNDLVPMWLKRLDKEVDCNVFISFSPEDYNIISKHKGLLDPALVLRDDLGAILV